MDVCEIWLIIEFYPDEQNWAEPLFKRGKIPFNFVPPFG